MEAESVHVMEDVFEWVATALEVLGAAAMVIGLLLGFGLAVRVLLHPAGSATPGVDAFSKLRRTLAGAIMLGLEILVAADLIRTITSKPSIEDAVILGLIVLIRTVLSISIQIEMDGVLPWKRALLTSGATVVAREVKHAK